MMGMYIHSINQTKAQLESLKRPQYCKLRAAEGNAQIDKAVEILCSRALLLILTYCLNVLTANMTSAVALLKAL